MRSVQASGVRSIANGAVHRPCRTRKRVRSVTSIRGSSEPQDNAGNVQVTFQAKEGGVVSTTAPAGTELRRLMLDNKVDLYTTWGKVWQCGGYGQCGTCIVEVVDGADVLSPRSKAELKHLKGKSDSWRLACQADITGGSGAVTIKTKPQS